MATSARSSHGTQLKIGDGGSPTENFTTIAEVKDISGPSISLNTEDVTNHDSGGWKEFIPTLLESEEVTFEVNYYNAATQAALETALNTRATKNFRIVFPLVAPLTKAFTGIVTKFGFDAPVEGIVKASVTIKISGPVTTV